MLFIFHPLNHFAFIDRIWSRLISPDPMTRTDKLIAILAALLTAIALLY